MRHNQLPAWQALREQSWHYQGAFDLRRAFARQPGRFEAFRVEAPHVVADLSKNLWDGPVLDALCALADTLQLPQKRAALLAGEVVNPTEGRPALHACVRGRWAEAPDGPADPWTDGLRDMLALAEAVRADPDIDHVVHLGIGGSGLGPELVVQALAAGHGARQRSGRHTHAHAALHHRQQLARGPHRQRRGQVFLERHRLAAAVQRQVDQPETAGRQLAHDAVTPDQRVRRQGSGLGL